MSDSQPTSVEVVVVTESEQSATKKKIEKKTKTPYASRKCQDAWALAHPWA
jgi:hypothetical protein